MENQDTNENPAGKSVDSIDWLGVPNVDRWGNLSETFLTLEDGVVKVKDGRTLEEYINDPRLIKRRKGMVGAMVLCHESVYLDGLIPHCA